MFFRFSKLRNIVITMTSKFMSIRRRYLLFVFIMDVWDTITVCNCISCTAINVSAKGYRFPVVFKDVFLAIDHAEAPRSQFVWLVMLTVIITCRTEN